MKRKGTKDLTYTQRLQLEGYLKAGLHKKEIARLLGVCLATVYNELKRGECEQKKHSYTDYWGENHYKIVKAYSPELAQERYKLNMTTHGAPLKVGNDYDFVRYVEKRVVEDKLSPCAVVGEIRRLKPCRTIVSKTTMYRYIAQGIFMGITSKQLPFGQRKKHYCKTIAKRPPRGTSIERRPADIALRNEFGHWEMDLVVGRQYTRNVLLVLSERKTRFEIVRRLPNRKMATIVGALDKLERRYGRKFRQLFKSITVDNGSEFSDFAGLERSVYGGRRTAVYYCHPYTSCERGTNERLNRDIRRHFPKKSDFSKCTDRQVQAVEDWLNAYPREIFGFATPAELYAREFAAL